MHRSYIFLIFRKNNLMKSLEVLCMNKLVDGMNVSESEESILAFKLL